MIYILLSEEVIWKQRSRISWLKEGDKNTKFFHSNVSQRQNRNRIEGLLDEVGVWNKGDEAVGEMAINYFQNIFSTTSPSNMEDLPAGNGQVGD